MGGFQQKPVTLLSTTNSRTEETFCVHLLRLMSLPPKGTPLPRPPPFPLPAQTRSHPPERLTCSVVVIGRDP